MLSAGCPEVKAVSESPACGLVIFGIEGVFENGSHQTKKIIIPFTRKECILIGDNYFGGVPGFVILFLGRKF